jgi:hypothetical protein
MLIDRIELKLFVENNPRLVTRKESKRHPGLFVLKYTRRVFYDALWNESPMLLYCRGLIVDAEYNIVVKPFTKVFNYKENGAVIDMDETCVYVRKINGFMGVITYNPSIYTDRLILSTTGSLDSDFVDLIGKYILPKEQDIIDYCKVWVSSGATSAMTMIFEITDNTDPHIINEGQEGAWLIGANMNYHSSEIFDISENSLDTIAEELNFYRPEHAIGKFSDVVDKADSCKHEGYMVYGLYSNQALKIKSPYYLITKFIARASEGKFKSIMNMEPNSMERVDEEFYPLIEWIRRYRESFVELSEQDKIDCIRGFLNGGN